MDSCVYGYSTEVIFQVIQTGFIIYHYYFGSNNYSEKEMRRVDLTFSIGYGDNFEEAKQIIADICTANEKVLKDPAHFIRVVEHGASSINIVTRVWVFNSDYWDVYFDLLESVKKAFDEKGIEIPFNQIDVHVKND